MKDTIYGTTVYTINRDCDNNELFVYFRNPASHIRTQDMAEEEDIAAINAN